MSLTALAFVLGFMVFCVLAFARHPIWGLYAYLLTFYLGPDTAWWGASLPNLRWSMLSALVTLLAVLAHKQPPGRVPWHQFKPIRALMLFVVWLWIQTPWVLSLDNHLFLATLFTKYILMFALVYACLDDHDKVYQFAIAHILGCFWWGYLAWQHPGGGRLEDIGTGDVAGSAFASMHVSTALALAGFMFMSFKGWWRWIPFLAVPFILNSVILMQTRAAFVGLLAAVPVALVLGPPAKRALVMFYLVLAGALLLMVANDAFWERMDTIQPAQGEQMEDSAASRLDIGAANLRMAADYPMGVGHRGNDLLSPRYMPERLLTSKEGARLRSAHNTELAILVDHGWLGLLLIAIFHARLIKSMLKLRQRLWRAGEHQPLAIAAALATCLVIYWVNGQFANMTKAEIVIWMAAMTAAMHSFVPAVAKQEQAAAHSGRVAGRHRRKSGRALAPGVHSRPRSS